MALKNLFSSIFGGSQTVTMQPSQTSIGNASHITYLYPDSFRGNPENMSETDIRKNLKTIDASLQLKRKISTDSYNLIFEVEGKRDRLILKVTPTYKGDLEKLSKLYIEHAKKEADLLTRISNDEFIGEILGTYVFCNAKKEERSVFIIERQYQNFAEYWNSDSKSESRVCKVLGDVLKDLNYIHTYFNIIHRDIKPGNLVVKHDVEGAHVLLIDFNVSREIDMFKRNSGLTFTGTEGFIAPEVVTGHYDCRADIYSLGILAYYLFTGVLPSDYKEQFPELNTTEVNLKIYDALIESGASSEFANIIFKAIKIKPDDRFSSAVEMNNEMIKKLSHLGEALPEKLEPVLYYYSQYPSGQIRWIGKSNPSGMEIAEIEEDQSGIEEQLRKITSKYPDFKEAVKNKKVRRVTDKLCEDINYIQTVNKLGENEVFSQQIQDNIANGYPLIFKRYDVVTFEEDDKVVVLESLLYKGVEYVFVNEILPDESDVTNVYKIMRVFDDGTLEKVVDPSLLMQLSPMFQKRLERYVSEDVDAKERSKVANEEGEKNLEKDKKSIRRWFEDEFKLKAPKTTELSRLDDDTGKIAFSLENTSPVSFNNFTFAVEIRNKESEQVLARVKTNINNWSIGERRKIEITFKSKDNNIAVFMDRGTISFN